VLELEKLSDVGKSRFNWKRYLENISKKREGNVEKK